MITKAVDKIAKSQRTAVSRRAARCDPKSARDQASTTTIAGKRDVPADQHIVPGRVSKHAELLQLLNRPEGATIEDMMQATDWQQHSVRGFLSGTVKKKMGLTLTSSKVEGESRRYRIATRRGR